MTPTSMLNKSISIAALIASTASFADSDSSEVEKLTGPNQAKSHSICVKVSPHFAGSRGSSKSTFYAFVLDGVSPTVQDKKGGCDGANETGSCAKGFVKITSTAPIVCHAPVAL